MENIKYPVSGNAEINLAANELNEENTEKVSGGTQNKKRMWRCYYCNKKNNELAKTCHFCGKERYIWY